MKISLIGMSGSGKSFWTKKLSERGFKAYCVDDLVEKKLEPELKTMGFAGIQDVAKWMGQPYDKEYYLTSRKYLSAEIKAMGETLNKIAGSSDTENIVLDTTGSVIYTGEAILSRLKELTKVIYLETPQAVQDSMYRLYLADPKPVIWGNVFRKKEDEGDITALGRCYPTLLEFRTGQYKKLADITVNYETQHSEGFDLNGFMKEIER